MDPNDEFQNLPPGVQLAFRTSLADTLGVDLSKIPLNVDSKWLSETSIDSLDFIELLIEVQEEFGGDDNSETLP
ncbi:MAG: acyl carrier protein [Planctomycetota bacterium]